MTETDNIYYTARRESGREEDGRGEQVSERRDRGGLHRALLHEQVPHREHHAPADDGGDRPGVAAQSRGGRGRRRDRFRWRVHGAAL